MLLRRITTHIKAQNWFAVFLDFLIVVVGVFIGLQVQQWAVEQDRKVSETVYLERLHGEVVQLQNARRGYDASRRDFSSALVGVAEQLNEKKDGLALTQEQSNAIAGSAHTTIPPSDLPTITELLSSGRLDDLGSSEIRTRILTLVQHAMRARDLINAISDANRDLGKAYPEMIVHNLAREDLYGLDGIWLHPTCDAAAMQDSAAFMAELNENAYQYSVYTKRAVVPVSEQVSQLHDVLDEVLKITHEISS